MELILITLDILSFIRLMDVIERMKREMLRRRLSRRTIKTYLFYVRKFLDFCFDGGVEDVRKISKKNCREFLFKFMNKEFSWMDKRRYKRYKMEGVSDEVAGSSLNVVLNSVRFLMEEVLRKSMRLNIKYSKVPRRLPVCLSKDEVRRLIGVICNFKHRILVSLMYGAGLRVSEVVGLKNDNLEFDEGIGWVRGGKGNKDRPFIMPECLRKDLLNIVENNKKQESFYLFSGLKKSHLSVRTVQVVVKEAAKKVGINKNVHPHTLRHSFATHVLENGADVTVVQSLLGHNESRTTMEYLHVVKPKMISVKSPLDEF
jgi:integrase/recombinase XerD